jgi:hypothetical protein
MRGSKADIPVAFEPPEASIREIEWGGMNVELGSFHQEADNTPLLQGLPDDRCQCPHWGYVLQGQLRFTFADHEEVYHAGDVYYAAAGHTTVVGADTEYVEFSPVELYHQTIEVIVRNFAAMQQQA